MRRVTQWVWLAASGAAVLALTGQVHVGAAPSALPAFDWHFDGSVSATARVGNVLYVGGDFHQVTPRAGGAPTARRSLAEFDATTGALLPPTIVLDPRPFGADTRQVRNLAVVGQVLYVTGEFGDVNGAFRGGSAFAYDAGTAAILPWSHRSDNTNQRIVHDDASGIYIAASNGLVRRYDLTAGAMDPVWLPDLTAQIVVADGELWASRPFPNFSVNPAQGGSTSIGVLDPVTGLFDERIRTPLLLPWHGLVLDGDTIYVAGQAPDLTLQINQPDVADRIVAFDRATGVPVSPAFAGDLDTGPSAQGDALAMVDGRLMVAGRRMSLGGVVRLGLAEIAGPGRMTPWAGVDAFRGLGVRVHGDLLVARGVATDQAATGRVVAIRLDGQAPPSALRSRTVGATTTFTWAAASPSPGDLYVLEGGTASGQAAASAPGGTGTTSAVPLPGPGFFVRVRTHAALETSNEVFAGCVVAPRPPSGLTATLAGPTLTATWIAPPGAVAGYTIDAGTSEGLADIARVAVPASQPTIAAAVPPGVYHLQVRALNACGESGPSGRVQVTVGAPVSLPAAPTALRALVYWVGGVPNVATITWTAPTGAVSGYRLEAGTAPGLANITTVTLGPNPVFQIAGVPRGEYYLRVRALNAAGVGAPSRDVLLTMP